MRGKNTMDRKEPQVLIEKISRHEAYQNLLRKIGEGGFPIDLAEAESSFLSLVVAALRKKKKILFHRASKRSGS
jgi:hypothetical protein